MTDEEAADAFARQAEAEQEEESQADTDNAQEESVGDPADVPVTDGNKIPSPLALAELSPDARMFRKPLEKVGNFGKVVISGTGVIQFASGVPLALKRIKGLPADAVVISDTGKMVAATDDSASLLAQAAGVSLRHMPDNKTFAIVPSDDGRSAVQSLLSSGYDIVTVSKDGTVTVTQGKRMTKKDVERMTKQRKRFEEDADDALSRDLEERAREGGPSAMMSVGDERALNRAIESQRDVVDNSPSRQKSPGGTYPNMGVFIESARFSIGAKRKNEYRALIGKTRPNLPSEGVDAFMAELDTLNDTKKEKAALHWFVKGSLILPEDRDKLDMATQMAGKYHLDFQAFDSPAALINEANARARHGPRAHQQARPRPRRRHL